MGRWCVHTHTDIPLVEVVPGDLAVPEDAQHVLCQVLSRLTALRDLHINMLGRDDMVGCKDSVECVAVCSVLERLRCLEWLTISVRLANADGDGLGVALAELTLLQSLELELDSNSTAKSLVRCLAPLCSLSKVQLRRCHTKFFSYVNGTGTDKLRGKVGERG